MQVESPDASEFVESLGSRTHKYTPRQHILILKCDDALPLHRVREQLFLTQGGGHDRPHLVGDHREPAPRGPSGGADSSTGAPLPRASCALARLAARAVDAGRLARALRERA